MEGFTELYAFVKALEMDHALAMRGVAICYGIVPKSQPDISQSIGWIKPTKRQRAAMNDGCPPDTTKALLDCPRKQVKISRPPNSTNINCALHTTYKSYAASKDPKMKNCCWLASAMETLYAVYSPLWPQSPGGIHNNLFNLLVSHFSSRTTNELWENKHLKSILTCGANSLFNEEQRKHPGSFVSGHFSSCDYFFLLVLDPQKNTSSVLPSLFFVQESRDFSCPLKKINHNAEHPPEEQMLFVLQLTQCMFECNSISGYNILSLITKWSTFGLDGGSCLQCQLCNALRTKKKSKSKDPNGPEHHAFNSRLIKRSIISFPKSGSPLHLYFQINAVPRIGNNQKSAFMGQLDWPFNLSILGEVYTLFSCEYWGNNHYWGKVFMRTIQGVTGVWLHNDLENAGYAQMIDSVPGSISGAHPNTLWLVYLQAWTPDEASFVNTSIDRIRRDNPNITSSFPFSHMENLLKISYNGTLSMETSIPPKTPNSSMIETQTGNNKKLSSQSLHKCSDHLSGNDSINDALDESGTESEDGLLFNPPQASHPPSPPPLGNH
jgi:hypothetical protein